MNEEMLERTDFACAPWTIVEATDREFATVKIYSAVIRAMEQKIREAKRGTGGQEAAAKVEKQLEEHPTQDKKEDNVLRTSSLNSIVLADYENLKNWKNFRREFRSFMENYIRKEFRDFRF